MIKARKGTIKVSILESEKLFEEVIIRDRIFKSQPNKKLQGKMTQTGSKEQAKALQAEEKDSLRTIQKMKRKGEKGGW